VVTFTGDDTASKFIEVGFTPDFVWIKPRGAVASHALYDSTRGDDKRLSSNSNAAEGTVPNEIVTNGFNIIGTTGYNDSSLGSMVAWCWKANGGTTSSNTDGSITSTVQANQDAGFSIVKYTGNGNTSQESFGHGLSSVPELIIQKSIDTLSTYGTNNWVVGGTAVGSAGSWLELNTADAKATDSNYWGNQLPSSTVAYISGSAERVHNESGKDFINYCFHSVENFSKIGSYTGNGSANGPIIETGFEPAFLMIKRTDSDPTGGAGAMWIMYDNKRSPLNPRKIRLWADGNYAEATYTQYSIDFLSNGFQLKDGSSGFAQNTDGGEYIYMAFAADPDTEQPTLADSFAVKTYTGDGTSNKQIDLGFKPGLYWLKTRDTSGCTYHNLFDIIRGGNKTIYSNVNSAEVTNQGCGYIQSFDDNGVTYTGDASGINNNGEDFVAWAWKADDNEPTINTEGTIDSLVSANPEAGFSIVKYTTTTDARVGHGLSQAPEIVLQKTLSSANSFFFANNLVSGTDDWEYLEMANDNAQTTNWTYYDGAEAPNATTFKDGWPNNTEMITYCFHSVSGYSKFGSYSGTGSSGNSVNVGFQPDWVMMKAYDDTSDWFVVDSVRDGNPHSKNLRPNNSNAESTAASGLNFTSTGWTFTGAAFNDSGVDWIYMAFKMNPTPYPLAGNMSFLVIAGGGGGSSSAPGYIGGAGGGAGGLRTSYGSSSGGGSSSESDITLAAGTYTITVGAGGGGASSNADGSDGIDSSIAASGLTTITSIGGGGGAKYQNSGRSGGSGGGVYFGSSIGSGTANQGFNGGTAAWGSSSGGGGGAGAVGGTSDSRTNILGSGGAGLSVSISGASVAYAGGGGTGKYKTEDGGPGLGGSGVGGAGASSSASAGGNGVVNTGSGGGGGFTGASTTTNGGDGSSGVVILRLLTSEYSGTTTGSPTVTTDGDYSILKYTGSGTYVHS
jgi:hypothetical protein